MPLVLQTKVHRNANNSQKFSPFQTTIPGAIGIAIAIAIASAPFHTNKLSNRITKKIHNAKANTHFKSLSLSIRVYVCVREREKATGNCNCYYVFYK